MGIEGVKKAFEEYSKNVSVPFAVDQVLNGSRLREIETWTPETSTEIASFLMVVAPGEFKDWARDHMELRGISVRKDVGYRRSLSVRIAAIRAFNGSGDK